MSLTELVETLLAKKEKCIFKKQKIKFVKLALDVIWWILENFTVDLSIEYIQCIQLITMKNMEEYFDDVSELLKKLYKKISVNLEKEEDYGLS